MKEAPFKRFLSTDLHTCWPCVDQNPADLLGKRCTQEINKNRETDACICQFLPWLFTYVARDKTRNPKTGTRGKIQRDSIVKQEESNWSRIKSFQLCCKDAWEIPIFKNLITKHQKNINSLWSVGQLHIGHSKEIGSIVHMKKWKQNIINLGQKTSIIH